MQIGDFDTKSLYLETLRDFKPQILIIDHPQPKITNEIILQILKFFSENIYAQPQMIQHERKKFNCLRPSNIVVIQFSEKNVLFHPPFPISTNKIFSENSVKANRFDKL
jgi:hypothetical protein